MENFVGQMMQMDAGAVRFVTDFFLFLDPEDLKACRLVSKQWAEFIKREVWNNEYGKKRLTQMLLQRWMTENPKEEVLFNQEVNLENREITNMLCDEEYVYCADKTGKVMMFRLSDGVMERELNPGPEDERLDIFDSGYLGHPKMAAKKDLLALTGSVRDPVLITIPTLTVCNTTTSGAGEVVFRGGSRGSRIMAMEVMEGKIAIVEGSGDGWRHRSLVVIEKVDNIWIRKDLRIEKVDNVWMRKDLAQWPLPRSAETCMASYNDVWVVLELDIDTLRVYTGSDDGKELKMPVSGNEYTWVMSMSLPFLVTLRAQGSRNCIVQVFKVPTEDIGTDISLLKSINIEGVGFITSPLKPFYSNFVVGVLYSRQTVGDILHVFDTAKLLDVSVLPENVEWREVKLGTGNWNCRARNRSMNTTSLVYIKNQGGHGQPHRQSLVKRDFWMSNSKSE